MVDVDGIQKTGNPKVSHREGGRVSTNTSHTTRSYVDHIYENPNQRIRVILSTDHATNRVTGQRVGYYVVSDPRRYYLTCPLLLMRSESIRAAILEHDRLC